MTAVVSSAKDDLDRTIEMLARLIAFDTTSRNSNLALIDDVRAFLAERGIASRLVHNSDGTKANLLATIGPMVPGGITLSGHTDVVPVDGQAWDTDPFVLSEHGDRLFGRGTADMKSFLAVTLAAVDEMRAAPLKVPLHLALTYDEEVGCLGAPSLIRFLNAELPPPAAVIVGEPTEMNVVTAHKGRALARTTVTGHEVHSSQTQRGVSAVMVAAELIGFLQGLGETAARSGPQDPLFDPPYTTVTVNTIAGGTASNIMARHCSFEWDVRSVPADEAQSYVQRFDAHCREKVLPRLRAIAPSCDIVTESRPPTPALAATPSSIAEEICRRLTGDNSSRGASYTAEAGQYQETGLSAVLCGPGSISQAHQPNEFISRAQLAAGRRFIRDLIAYASR